MIISIDAEKASNKIQHPVMIKTLHKTGIEGNYLHMMRATYDESTANITLNGERPSVPLDQEQDKGACRLSRLLLNTIPEVLAGAARQRRIKASKLKRKK